MYSPVDAITVLSKRYAINKSTRNLTSLLIDEFHILIAFRHFVDDFFFRGALWDMLIKKFDSCHVVDRHSA